MIHGLKRKVDRICEMRDEIDSLNDNIEQIKVSLIRDMTELQVDRIASENGVALVMDFERGTLSGELVETGLEKATVGQQVTIDDCKTYTHLNFLLIKRNKEN
ncbi:MAG: hypothetical protein RSC84_03230 [Peptostreptococcaceae bacterium]